MGQRWLGFLMLGLGTVGVLAGLTGGLAAAAPEMDGPYIINDLEAARVKARATGKPLFVVFRCER